jgi:serine/threonine protein kinase
MLVDVGPGRPEHVYLSDFGVARGMLSSSGLTRAGQFLGTPDYAAPEQINGLPVDGRTDQYALGCVAYALLTGSVPFRRDVPMAVLYAHLSAPPPRVTKLQPDLPAAVDEVLAQAMAKAPKDRYDSCGAFADALREALGLDPYDPSRPGRLTDQTRIVTPVNPVTASRAAATAPLTVPPDSAATRLPPGGSQAATVGTWTAVVSADRAYYDRVQAASGQEAASIKFPVYVPERRFELSGSEVRIGRRSVSRHIEPEIDLTGPPKDTGVSRLHALLVAQPDGTWSVVDLGTQNGILVNGKDVPPREPVPLRDGDRIHLGAWTLITIVRG